MGSQGPTSLHVVLEKSCNVVPSTPMAKSSLFLSNIDQLLPYNVETIFFYDGNGGPKTDDVIEELKKSLSKLLVHYYFMAGRFNFDVVENRMEVNCNNAGVPFVEASSPLNISELGDLSFPNPLFRELIFQVEGNSKPSEVPLLTIQITHFRCGGFSFGLITNHALMDGLAVGDFLTNFGSICRGEGLKIIPTIDKSSLRARDIPHPTYEHPELMKLQDITEDIDVSSLWRYEVPEKYIHKVYHISKKMMNSLKTQVLADKYITKCSAFEALAAHIWQVRTKSIDMAEDQDSKMFMVVDIRDRLVPPLPKGFAGNGIIGAFASLKSKILHEKPLSFCVEVVQKAISIVTNDYIKSTLDWLEIYHGVPSIFGGFFLSTWWRLPFYEFDFGWGKPLFAGPVCQRVEYVLMLPTDKDDGGINICLALEPYQMRKFDQLFYKI